MSTAPDGSSASAPLLGYTPTFVALRYLLRKKLAYLAVCGIALSVGTLIVVMSVFTGFQLKLTAIIRGYLSDLIVQPLSAAPYSHSLRDWELFRQKALAQEHVVGVAPFVRSVGLMRLPGTDVVSYVMLRGVHPGLELDVSDIGDHMTVGQPSDLDRTYAGAHGRFRSCFVGKQFPGFSAELLQHGTGRLVLVAATRSLEKRLKEYAVNGMFETGNYEYDSQMVIMALETATDLVDSDGAVTGLSVKLDDYENAGHIREELAARLARGTLLRAFGDGSPAVTGVALSATGSRAAMLTETGAVEVHDVVADKPSLQVAPTSSRPTAIALDYDGGRLLVGHADGSTVVRRADGKGEEVVLQGPREAVTAACFSPDGFMTALGYHSGAVQLWDAETGERGAALKGHAASVTEVQFDRASEKLLTISADGTGSIWDAETGRLLTKLAEREGQRPPLSAGAFGPEGDFVITGDSGGRATLWHAELGRPLFGWQAHPAEVLAVGFSRPANLAATAGADGMAFWGRPATEVTGSVQRLTSIANAGEALKDAVFTPDAERLLGTDGRARLYYGGSGFRVETWEEQRKTFVEAVAMERFLMALILSLILVVAEFFIFAIVTTMVNERRRDIGILKAIGFARRQICQVFLTAGLAIGVMGALLGVGAGLLFADNINAIRGFIKATIGFDPFP
ncbi:MAG: FtsX-like permease family protein, partial [Planctomycetota bacterium]